MEPLPICGSTTLIGTVAQKTADALLAHEKSGDDNAATDGATFARLLTSQMRDASHDMHLVVEYSQRPLPVGPPVQTAESLARFRNAMLQQNCMIRKVEILPHDIGYLKLDFFPDTSVCGSALKAAMASLNRADASSLICGITRAAFRTRCRSSPATCSIIRSICTGREELRRWTPGHGLLLPETNWQISRCMC